MQLMAARQPDSGWLHVTAAKGLSQLRLLLLLLRQRDASRNLRRGRTLALQSAGQPHRGSQRQRWPPERQTGLKAVPVGQLKACWQLRM